MATRGMSCLVKNTRTWVHDSIPPALGAQEKWLGMHVGVGR